MDSAVTASITGIAGTIVAAVVGVVFGRSERLDRFFRRGDIVDLRGDWESTWMEPSKDIPSGSATS